MNLREREELAHGALNTKVACRCKMFLETQKLGLDALQYSGEYGEVSMSLLCSVLGSE
jgi:hypothetical protein